VPAKDFREVLRVTRADETRIYGIRIGEGGAELWRVSEAAGEPARSIKECDLAGPDEASDFLDEVRRTLKAGGWQEV
jgi:hypothetical protein